MRTLMIWGVLAVCVLLVTPSYSDRTEDEGGEKGISTLREFIGQNEDGGPKGIEAGSSLAIDWQAQPRSRRQDLAAAPKPRRGKNCPGCFTSLVVKDHSLPKGRRSRQAQKPPKSTQKPPKSTQSGRFGLLSKSGTVKRSKEKPTNNPPLPGMFSVLSAPDLDAIRPPREESRKGRKRNGGKHCSKEKEDGVTRRDHHQHDHHHPESEVEEKTKRGHRHHHHRHHHESGKKGKKRCGHRHHHRHHPESGKEEKIIQRSGSYGLLSSFQDGDRKEDLTDQTETAERIRRNSDNTNTKEQKNKRRSGSRSLIASLKPLGSRNENSDRKIETHLLT